MHLTKHKIILDKHFKTRISDSRGEIGISIYATISMLTNKIEISTFLCACVSSFGTQ